MDDGQTKMAKLTKNELFVTISWDVDLHLWYLQGPPYTTNAKSYSEPNIQY